MLSIAVGVVGAAIVLALASANRVGRVLGYRGQRILLRFMGLTAALLCSPRDYLLRTVPSQPLADGYGSGRASWVTRTGQSDLAKTASVVDVHWRGGPITRTSTSDVSVSLTISVAGIPCRTSTSVSHHEWASGGIAAINCL
jgi:hypothetical protein